jgi:small subunit ribosomal protein S4
MVRYTGPKNRIARKFGANIFGKKRNPLAHKVNPPGQHGAKRTKKSDYGIQLEEKQKLRACYGMLQQKTLTRYYKEASKLEGNTPDLFMQRIETRLDSIVYRLKFATTIFHAQQLVAHGHILVNGKKVDIRSFEVQEGMTVSIAQKSKNNALIKEALERSAVNVPEYLSLDGPSMSGKLLVKPQIDQIPLPIPINVGVVCEFLAYTT